MLCVLWTMVLIFLQFPQTWSDLAFKNLKNAYRWKSCNLPLKSAKYLLLLGISKLMLGSFLNWVGFVLLELLVKVIVCFDLPNLWLCSIEVQNSRLLRVFVGYRVAFLWNFRFISLKFWERFFWKVININWFLFSQEWGSLRVERGMSGREQHIRGRVYSSVLVSLNF